MKKQTIGLVRSTTDPEVVALRKEARKALGDLTDKWRTGDSLAAESPDASLRGVAR
jgi:hypothetical protein